MRRTATGRRKRGILLAASMIAALLGFQPVHAGQGRAGGPALPPDPNAWVDPTFPCANPTVTYHSYSQCIANQWHVVTDAYYSCAGKNATQRVHDYNTGQACAADGTVPNVTANTTGQRAGLRGCAAARYIGEEVVTECINNFWHNVYYKKFVCLDGTTCLDGPPSYSRTNEACPSPQAPRFDPNNTGVAVPAPRAWTGFQTSALTVPQGNAFAFAAGNMNAAPVNIAFADGGRTAIDSAFQTMVMEGSEIEVADASGPALPMARQARAGSFWTLLTSFFQRPGTAVYGARRWQPPIRLDGSPAAMRQAGGASALKGLLVAMVATGNSSGDTFQLQVVNGAGASGRLLAPDGLVLQPVRQMASAALAGVGKPSIHSLAGYCLDFAKLPPRAGSVFRIAENALQERFRPVRSILQAARELSSAGQLRPDSEPASYTTFVKQWAVWTRLERWDERRFGEQYVTRTRRNVEALKQRWTREVEQEIRASIPNRWRDITAVLERAAGLEGGAGPAR